MHLLLPVSLALALGAGVPKAAGVEAPAARQGDPTSHGGAVLQGSPNVMISGAPAARQGDLVSCPLSTPGNPPVPHSGGPIVGGSATVRINGRPAARAGDAVAEAAGPGSTLVAAQGTVIVN